MTTGWAVVVSLPPRDFAQPEPPRRCWFVSGCQMRCGASVACAPLQNRQMAFFSRACPYPPAAALLCHLARGPLLHFRKSASGQSPPAGGPLAADLSNRTRRASRQLVSSSARARALPGGPGNLPRAASASDNVRGCARPAQRSAARPHGAQLQPQLGCSRPSALRAAWNQNRAAVAGWGRVLASPSHGPATGRASPRASPPERFFPVCSLPIHRRARLAAHACWATKHDNCDGVSVA